MVAEIYAAQRSVAAGDFYIILLFCLPKHGNAKPFPSI